MLHISSEVEKIIRIRYTIFKCYSRGVKINVTRGLILVEHSSVYTLGNVHVEEEVIDRFSNGNKKLHT